MASTSLSLGSHWEEYIQSKIASGRYGTATEVVRDALRKMEELDERMMTLRAHLAEGDEQARKREFKTDYSLDGLINDLDAE